MHGLVEGRPLEANQALRGGDGGSRCVEEGRWVEGSLGHSCATGTPCRATLPVTLAAASRIVNTSVVRTVTHARSSISTSALRALEDRQASRWTTIAESRECGMDTPDSRELGRRRGRLGLVHDEQ